jgi:hypothetical protein
MNNDVLAREKMYEMVNLMKAQLEEIRVLKEHVLDVKAKISELKSELKKKKDAS